MSNAAPAPEMLGSKVTLPTHIAHRAFVSETVVLNLQTGTYHGLNPVGGRMLETLERSPTVQAAAETLAGEYEQPLEDVQRDLLAFCADLLERGLIEVTPA
jgi:Coenzyme PQQ synthesis protein D (PqqD)